MRYNNLTRVHLSILHTSSRLNELSKLANRYGKGDSHCDRCRASVTVLSLNPFPGWWTKLPNYIRFLSPLSANLILTTNIG